MGVMNHNAIIATTGSRGDADEFLKWFSELDKNLFDFSLVVRIPPTPTNAYHTFFFAPDGSKEGWPDSNFGDNFRDMVIEYLESKKYEDGSSCWRWVEVGFGEFGQQVLRGNNKNLYSKAEYYKESK